MVFELHGIVHNSEIICISDQNDFYLTVAVNNLCLCLTPH